MEFRRILLGKTFLSILGALIALNSFFFLYQQTDQTGDFRAYPQVYHQVVQAYAGRDWEEAMTEAQAFEGTAFEAIMADPTWGTVPENVHRFTAELEVVKQFEYLLGYKEYMADIQTQAERLQAVSIFSKPGSFAYKNTVKTAADFAPLQEAEVSFGHDLAVTKVFEDEWADYSCVLVMIVVCALFLAERKEGLWPMLHAASGGRRKLAAKRIGILLLSAWAAALALFGSKILLSGWLFHGLGEWGRTIQSISLFYNVPREMTVGQFWVFYVVMKAMGTFLIGLILWTILSAISNVGLAFCGAGLVLGVEFACTAILPSSLFAMLRYVNIFSYIRFFEVFSTYLNLPVFGLLVAGSDLVLWLVAPVCVLFSGIALAIAEKKYPVAPANRILSAVDRLMKKTDPRTCGGSLLSQEARKLLLRRKGALLLVALLLVAAKMDAPDRKYDPLDMYYQYYQGKYSGPITQETLASLEAEMENADSGERASALNMLLMKAEAAPEGSWLVPTAPYEAIWSENYGNYHRSTALMTLLFLVLILSPIASQERQSDMTILLRSTSGGRKKLWRRKQILLLLVTTAVWAIVCGAELSKTAELWGPFRCLYAPAYSLEAFRRFHWPATIGQTMALYYGAKWLVLLAVGEVCLFLSGRCAKNRDAILLCCGIILIPASLAAIGSGMGEGLSFLLPLGGVELFGNPAAHLVVFAIGGLAFWLSRRRRGHNP